VCRCDYEFMTMKLSLPFKLTLQVYTDKYNKLVVITVLQSKRANLLILRVCVIFKKAYKVSILDNPCTGFHEASNSPSELI